jgi:hypothetical protein
MKLAIAISCILFSTTIGKAQLTYLSQNRVVSAQSEIRRSDFPNPGEDFHGFDEQSQSAADFGPFMATVTATAATDAITNQGPATATGWQESSLLDDEIRVSGGVRAIHLPSTFGVGESSSISSVDLTFSVSEPLRATLTADLLWSATRTYQFNFFNGGSVGYRLFGPNVDVSPDLVDDPTGSPVHMEHFIHDIVLTPGSYTLSVSARNGSDRQESINVPVNFDVALAVFPIPEPDAVLFSLIALATFAILRRYWLAHFGK